ncbi:AraC family transcriptional regulator [Gracilimonas sp.]|uniref:AraC family transcriptional regulator n=1 Tax=Gracilimonas sp. TaxID=1974203 RepID=UPI0032EB26A7
MIINSTKEIPLVTLPKFRERYTSLKSTGHYKNFDLLHLKSFSGSLPSHRIDFYLVILLEKGEMELELGSSEYKLDQPSLIFINPQIVYKAKTISENLIGYCLLFSDDFFQSGLPSSRKLRTSPLFKISNQPILCLKDEHVEYLNQLISLIEDELTFLSSTDYRVIQSLLHAIINKSESLYQKGHCKLHKPVDSSSLLVHRFQELLLKDLEPIKEHYPITMHTVKEYADELDVSQNYLNDTIKKVTGKTAGQLISEYLIDHATICLKHSDLEISEIAFRLGFDEPSYFSRVFKKIIGLSPTDYRDHTNL